MKEIKKIQVKIQEMTQDMQEPQEKHQANSPAKKRREQILPSIVLSEILKKKNQLNYTSN